MPRAFSSWTAPQQSGAHEYEMEIGPLLLSCPPSPDPTLVDPVETPRQHVRSPLSCSPKASPSPIDTRNVVLRILAELVNRNNLDACATAELLRSCNEACAKSLISFSAVLQEKSLNSHSPFYWVVVNARRSDVCELLSVFLSFASPLEPETVVDIRRGCLLTSNQDIFHNFCVPSNFALYCDPDHSLYKNSRTLDEVCVIESGDGFTVDFEFSKFQERVLAFNQIGVDFLAQERIWRLSFFISDRKYGDEVPIGTWCASLAVLDHSPPTWVSARLYIPLSKAYYSGEQPGTRITSESSKNLLSTIVVPLDSPGKLGPPTDFWRRRILTSLEQCPMGRCLKYRNSSYIAPNKCMRARLEASLSAFPEDSSITEDECIMC